MLQIYAREYTLCIFYAEDVIYVVYVIYVTYVIYVGLEQREETSLQKDFDSFYEICQIALGRLCRLPVIIIYSSCITGFHVSVNFFHFLLLLQVRFILYCAIHYFLNIFVF